MKKFTVFLVLVSSVLIYTSCDELFGVSEEFGLSESQVAAGLKEALIVGTDTAVKRVSAEDGYYQDALIKILLPAEAQPVYDKVQTIPLLGSLVDQTVLAINRAAEDAADEAAPIFVDAIVDMTVVDAWGILQGSDTAATSYLRKSTFSNLFDAFQPKISTSLSKEIIPGISAEESYEKVINTYNSASINGLLFDEIKTNSLSEHTTNRALSGLFVKVADEEQLIREDPAYRATELIQTVFAEQD
ncbi:MAG: DUF4197 domain-containing protein [Salibacteraceae bacterium]